MSDSEAKRKWLRDLQAEDGNVESALVLIPLMILFLTVAQIGLAAYSRTTAGELSQGAVAYSAMGIPQSLSTQSGSKSTQTLIALPLPGGGSILVGQEETRLPSITPLLPAGDNFDSTGIAVQE